MSTVPIITPMSESRLPKPGRRVPHSELPENPKVASIQHPPTPMPSVAGRDSKYRCKAVHSLPVSTTSYFRHVVSNVQSSINNANNGTVLNRHKRRFSFLIDSLSIIQLIPVRSPFLFFSFVHSQVTLPLETRTYISRVTEITQLLPNPN